MRMLAWTQTEIFQATVMPRDPIDIVLAALADPTRRRALQLLMAHDELCVCELMAELRVSQSRMSRHMSTLKAAGLVLDRRDAQWVRYRRNPNLPSTAANIVESIMEAMRKAKPPSSIRGRRTQAGARSAL